MSKTVEQIVREQNQLRQDQRNADAALLRDMVLSLPSVHPERAGLIRAVEILRTEKIEP